MKRYETYKPSGIDWLGEIPEHWGVERIKDYTYLKARIGWQGLRSDEFIDSSNWYCLTGTDFSDGKINWINCYCIDKDRYNQDKKIQLKIDDLLITKDGTIGKIALIDYLPKPTTLNSGVFVSRPRLRKYINSYMYWVLSSNVFASFIDLNKNGTTILHLYQNVFERFYYSTPPLSEQTAIANYLDTKTAVIDRKIELLTAKADKYKALRRSLINETVCRGLNPSIQLKDSGVEWIGMIPEHWEVKRLKDIAKVQTGNTPPMSDAENYSNIGLPWVKPNELFDLSPTCETADYISDIGKKQVRLIKTGSVMVCCIGSIGKIGIAGRVLCTNQQINSISFYKINPHFGKYLIFISKDEHMRHSTGNVLLILNCESQRRIEFAVPPHTEQTAIASYLDEKTTQIDTILTNIGEQINKLTQLRKTLINDVVTGQLEVTE